MSMVPCEGPLWLVRKPCVCIYFWLITIEIVCFHVYRAFLNDTNNIWITLDPINPKETLFVYTISNNYPGKNDRHIVLRWQLFRICFAEFKAYSPLEIFFAQYWMCWSQHKCWSRRRPRNLMCVTWSRFSSSILSVAVLFVVLFLLDISIYFVLLALTESWFALNQSVIWERSSLTFSNRSALLFPVDAW